ncbi:3638_t:CDS:2 [Gigaspora rosea]|nr:3638_t:CDS:2 [Gigaspora rosea]
MPRPATKVYHIKEGYRIQMPDKAQQIPFIFAPKSHILAQVKRLDEEVAQPVYEKYE